MSITCSTASFVPRVKDHREYEQMIFDIDVFLEFTDTETGSTIGYQLFHRFDTEFEYNDETPFVPFYDITEEELYNWIEEWKSAEVTHDGKNLTQWAEDKFASIYAEPKPAFFAWQTVPPIYELYVNE